MGSPAVVSDGITLLEIVTSGRSRTLAHTLALKNRLRYSNDGDLYGE
jgi:hypothetical protein